MIMINELMIMITIIFEMKIMKIKKKNKQQKQQHYYKHM